MTEPKYLIWSNYSLDYEDWREDLEAEYPGTFRTGTRGKDV